MEFNDLKNLMMSDRTVRRFRESERIPVETLEKVVELVRYCPSGRNAQPLRYVIVTSEDDKEKVYPLLKWAGYFKDWDGPEKGERPAAYIIQCLDTKYGNNCLCDDGLQLEAMTLGLRTLGIAGCIIKAFDSIKLHEELRVGERYLPRYVLAVGYPAENVEIEDMDGSEDADFKYYRTPDGTHHVPKRPLSELILKVDN
ncbi:MAG: nitroreductase family protein [Muribaculaceae bacterium]|nr:nitroreductase family protein [Muribaculaceae bacterium]